jgi:hypothetical protein
MIQAGHDIRQKCRQSLETIITHYKQHIKENPDDCVLGAPDTICAELGDDFGGVNDVAAAFVTPLYTLSQPCITMHSLAVANQWPHHRTTIYHRRPHHSSPIPDADLPALDASSDGYSTTVHRHPG